MQSSIPQLFLDFVESKPMTNFVHIPQKSDNRWQWEPVTRKEALQEVANFAKKLEQLGVTKGDTVAIWASTRAEWCLIDLAVLSLGAVVVGIYPTLMKEMVLEQLADSKASVLIVEYEEQVLQWEEEFNELDDLIHFLTIEKGEELLPIVVSSDTENPDKISWLKEQIANRSADELASIVYTSGTTGKSKGVLLTHRNFISNLESTKEVLPLGEGARSIVCLPLAHSLQRFVVYRAFVEDIEGYFAPSLRDIPITIQAAKPTILIAVPRMLEKIQQKIIQQAEQRSAIAALFVRWAVAVGWAIQSKEAKGQTIPTKLKWQWKWLEKIVVSPIRERLGGQLKTIVSGGAPLNDQTAKFFWGLGISVVEGWGLSETCAPATLNMEGVRKLGSVGKILSNMVLKIAEDGEILIKGEGVFSGYHQMDSRSYFQDGFFKTGDIGKIDDDGYLYITGRSKDIIVTAGGKNIAPQRIANLIEGELIHHCIVIGDQQKYLVALIAIDEEMVAKMAEKHTWSGGFDAWVTQEIVVSQVEERITSANQKLASFEQLKKYSILSKPLTEENGLLTSTQKPKKKEIIERYQNLWKELYCG